MRLKERFRDVGQGVDQQGLGQAGDADEEAVAAGEDGDQELLDDLSLADDDLAHLGLEALEGVAEAFDGGDVVVGQVTFGSLGRVAHA